MRVLFRWLVLALIIRTLPEIMSGIRVDSFPSALAAAAVLAILNVGLRPLLILLTLPLTVLSLGLFLLVLNALIFKWVGFFVSGFEVDSFGTAFLCSLILSVFSWFFDVNYTRDGGSRVVIVRGGKNQPGNSGPKVRDLN